MDDQIICRSVPLSTCCPSSPGLGESLAFLLLSFSEKIFYSTNSQLVYFMIDVVNSYFDRYSMSKVTHLVVEQPPLHIVRDNPGLSDKYFNPGESNRTLL